MAYTNIDRIYSKSQKTNAQYLKERIDYVTNDEKTNDGELISSFGCSSSIAHFEWDFTRQLYHSKKNNSLPPDEEELIAYRVIQSFKGYEVDFETANNIGYELAMQLTQGNHAFIVTTHIDTGNIHNHITWNAFEKDGNRKFNNTKNSYKLVEVLSNEICKKYDLSIIEKSNEEISNDYGTWLVIKNILKPKTHTDIIKFAIDEILEEKPKDFDEFLIKLKVKGFEIKVKNRTHISVRGENYDNFRRLDTIGGEYSQDKINERIENIDRTTIKQNDKSNYNPNVSVDSQTNVKSTDKLQIMLDVEQALREKGRGYQVWAERYNSNQLIKTMEYMHRNKLNSYEDLLQKIEEVHKNLQNASSSNPDVQEKLDKISKQQQAIRDYSKYKSVYNDYKNSGYSKKFKAENIEEITKFENAKQVYNELGKGEKFPTMDELKKEYAELNRQNSSADFYEIQEELQTMLTAKANLQTLLNIVPKEKEKEKEEQERTIELKNKKSKYKTERQ